MNYNKIVENNSKYLVCECDENKKSYTYKMLQNNNIDSLIKPVERNINGESFLYYKTDSYRTMEEIFNDRECFIRDKDIDALCKSFINLEHDLTDYLLDINDLVLKPDTLMYDNVKDAYVFIYIPGYSQDENEFHNSLLALWEYILSKYDHNSDMKRTMKVYETYQKIRSCNYTIGTLLYNMISVENVNGNMVADRDSFVNSSDDEGRGSYVYTSDATGRDAAKSSFDEASVEMKNVTDQNESTYVRNKVCSESYDDCDMSNYSAYDNHDIYAESSHHKPAANKRFNFPKNSFSKNNSESDNRSKRNHNPKINNITKRNHNPKTEKYIFITSMAVAIICTILILLPVNMNRPNLFILFIIIAISLFICFKYKHSLNNSKSKKLQIIYNDREFNPDNFPLTVGSKDEMDISIPENGVSRHHLTIYESEFGYYIEDNDSTNGTFINNKKINPFQKRVILDGDIVTLAETKLIICIS